MTGKIESKRDVLEFLWDWAEEKGVWAKLLLQEILNTPESLSSDKRNVIYKYFRKSIGLAEDVDEIKVEKPHIAFSGKSIRLTKLFNIVGLNRLSSKSVIEFSPNLTVVYGENGTGKSGFSRILKDIGYSYEVETKLFPNIYSLDNPDISAEIEYLSDGTPNKIIWKPGLKFEELKDISVYNSSCVAISLSDNRNLIVSPLGFSLFDRVSTELDAIAVLLANEIKTLTITFDWFENFNDGTDYKDKILNLQSLTVEEIEKIPLFTLEDQKQLDALEKIYANTSKELLERELDELNTQNSELEEIKQNIEKSRLVFSEAQWVEYVQVAKEMLKLEKKGYGSLEELAKGKGIELHGKAEFEEFLKAADTYIATIPDENYPDSKNARCIYCNQILHDSTSVDLLKKYKNILRDTTRQDIEKNREILANLKISFNKVIWNLKLHYPSYGHDEKQRPLQPEYLKTYNDSVEKVRHYIETNTVDNNTFIIDYQFIVNSLQEQINKIDQQKFNKNKTLEDIETEKSKLLTQINILKDKQLFSNKRADILNVIENYKIRYKLTMNENTFKTTSVSLRTTKARKELVEQSFADTFLKELSYLRKNNIKIELNFETKKGETNVRQRLGERYNLSDILSEGEQKAISLAEFFTELSIDGGNSTVVLDDPVNSLDHHIIDEIAKRLITLAKNRQTVVFTHSILLFNSLLHEEKQPYNSSVKIKFYNIKKQYELCGVISDDDAELNSPSFYVKKLNILVDNPPKDRSEEEVASEGYGYLRSAIELTVEYEILQGTVKRYQKNIALTNFIKLSGENIDKYKEELNNLFEKCCGFISAHSNPTEVASTPNMTQLKTDFEAYKAIRKVFNT